jgi:hypothetical protein
MCLYASGIRRFRCTSSTRTVAARNPHSCADWRFVRSIDATEHFSASTFSAADRDARIMAPPTRRTLTKRSPEKPAQMRLIRKTGAQSYFA